MGRAQFFRVLLADAAARAAARHAVEQEAEFQELAKFAACLNVVPPVAVQQQSTATAETEAGPKRL